MCKSISSSTLEGAKEISLHLRKQNKQKNTTYLALQQKDAKTLCSRNTPEKRGDAQPANSHILVCGFLWHFKSLNARTGRTLESVSSNPIISSKKHIGFRIKIPELISLSVFLGRVSLSMPFKLWALIPHLQHRNNDIYFKGL